MKKTILLCFLAFICIESFSQKISLGLKFAPGIAFSRVNEELDTLEASGQGVGIRFYAGPEVNISLGDNIFFTTGLWYMSKRASISIEDPESDIETIKQIFNLQYLQLPATLKLYTNDIAIDTKVYFQIGGTADIKIQQKTKAKEVLDYVENLRFFDFSALIGAGVQQQLGQTTYIYAGITYSRGLMGTISDFQNLTITKSDGSTSELPEISGLKNDLLGLDFGIRF